MLTMLATLKKEWLLLIRDKMGLLTLLLLPMLLVFFITLSHGDDKTQNIKILWSDQDQTRLSTDLGKALKKTSGLKISTVEDLSWSLDQAKIAVEKGQYQALIVLPKNFSTALQQHFYHPKIAVRSMQLMLDPGVDSALKTTLDNALTLLLKNLEIQFLHQTMAHQGHPFYLNESLDLLKNIDAPFSKNRIKPNRVQQNVPAWALFGMFFILIPMAGTMVREREFGVAQRLQIAPTLKLNILLGKMIAFVIFNQLQLWLMLSIGIYILPLLGMPKLDLSQHVFLLSLAGISASVAATSFGVLVGTYAKNYEQATVLGPFLIVIASAVGGIFVPSYLMPDSIQIVSQCSPLSWGQTAFLDILVRNGSWSVIFNSLIKLWYFGAFCLLLSLLKNSMIKLRTVQPLPNQPTPLSKI